MKLQGHGFEESSYERPNRKWACGRTCEGCPCKQGPFEKPIVNLFTASCSQKENKCKPVRTIRGTRAILNLAVIVFSCAMVIYVLQVQDKAFVNPGSLSFFHNTIESQKCSTCHDLNHHSSWLKASVSKHSSLDDSLKCLSCHRFNSKGESEHQGALDLASLHPHNVTDANDFGKLAHKFDEKLSCMTCHHEHRGYYNDMKKMSDVHCQDCHDSKMDSFGNGHPEFKLYPYKKEKYVNFSHQTHIKYFNDHRRTDLLGDENCQTCHNFNESNSKSLISTTREHVCSTCHAHTIPLNRQPVKLLALVNPLIQGVSKVAMFENTFSEGAIPELIDVGLLEYFNRKKYLLDIAEGKKSAVLSNLTLTSEDSVKSLVANLAGNWEDLLFLIEAQKNGFGFLKAMQWTIANRALAIDKQINRAFFSKSKSVISDFMYEDPELRKSLLMVMHSFDLTVSDKVSFAVNLESDKLRDFLTECATMLPPDIKKYVPNQLTVNDESSLVVQLLKKSGKLSKDKIEKLNGLLKNNSSSIYGYLRELDLPVKSSVHYTKFYSDLEKIVKKDHDLLKKLKSEYDNILPLFISGFLKDKNVAKSFIKLVDSDVGDLIDKNSLTQEKAEVLKVHELLIQLNVAYLIDKCDSTANTSEGLGIPNISPPITINASKLDDWQFDVDENGHSYLSYKVIPTHASPLLIKAYSNDVFPVVNDPAESMGRCLQCHTGINNEKIDNWVTPDSRKGLTKFSHSPHSKECSSCHIFKNDHNTSIEYANYTNEYRPLKKEDCMNCHKPNNAEDSCLKCHNYHPNDYAQQKAENLELMRKYLK